MIEIENVTKKFGTQTVLDNINLTINKGQKVLIAGQNGAGKSTLMRAILGQIIYQSGCIKINGIEPTKNREEALQNLSFVPQTPPSIKLSVEELCDYSIKSTNTTLEAITKYLDELNLSYTNESKKQFYRLSGGMKQKILIAIALARNSDIVLFDEPTANLDQDARNKFLSILMSKFTDKTIIFISHRLSEVKGMVGRIVEMDLGRIADDRIVE